MSIYVFVYSRFIDTMLKEIRVYVPKFFEMRPGDRVIDVCCGTGDQVFQYARIGIVATGIDLDSRMIEFAEKNRTKHGFNSVSFQQASALDLPFEDNSFDYASIEMALHEKERVARGRVILEMRRVVKNEGALVFLDYKVPYPKDALSYFVKAIEFMAGRDHFRCFRDYIKQGGLDELLSRNHLTVEKRVHLKKGPLAIIRARNG